jgi:hypothetical protein
VELTFIILAAPEHAFHFILYRRQFSVTMAAIWIFDVLKPVLRAFCLGSMLSTDTAVKQTSRVSTKRRVAFFVFIDLMLINVPIIRPFSL